MMLFKVIAVVIIVVGLIYGLPLAKEWSEHDE